MTINLDGIHIGYEMYRGLKLFTSHIMGGPYKPGMM